MDILGNGDVKEGSGWAISLNPSILSAGHWHHWEGEEEEVMFGISSRK
jgi:hypothetical protein